MTIEEFKQWWNRFEYSGNFPEPKTEHINLLLAEVDRLTAALAEKEHECKGLMNSNTELCYIMDAMITALDGKPVSDFAESFPFVRRLQDALAEAKAYKDVIDEALIVSCIGVASGDARADLHKLLVWEIDVALDPQVSKRAAGLLAEKDAEIEQLRKDNHAHCTALMTTAMWEGMEEKLQAAESLAASRLADQEAIERHVTKRVAGECAEIARDIRTTPEEGCETRCLGPCGPCAATAIRKKYGVTE